ncbi:MAG: helix-hairpin-helix domain-containing protein [Ghiorsea sp.]|nr:helix-hairpin-helix domain-containing protein [Ghiorsea sp.]
MKFIMVLTVLLSSLFFAQVSAAADQVNINSATVKELQAVKGIGEKTAEAIVQYRKKHGNFSNIAELIHVKGIGEKKLKKMKDSVKAGEGSSKSQGKVKSND